MAIFNFYDAGTVRQIATNLFYGWGYNFYRQENQLRADDLLVRSKAAWLLGAAAEAVEAAEIGYRREHLPPPTRKQPFPPAEAVAGAQQLERMAGCVFAAKAHILALPAPETDRMTQRFRNESRTLEVLIGFDQQLIGQCELLRSMVDRQTGPWLLENVSAVHDGLEAIASTLMSREAALLGRIV